MGVTYIVLVNWNGHTDTIECIESLFSLVGNFRVIIVDNASSDNSFEILHRWLSCQNKSITDKNSQTTNKYCIERSPPSISQAMEVTLISSPKNLGFSGGNNIGIEHALADDQCSYVWLLNNDCTVEPNTLEKMLDRMSGNETIGFCGSTIVFYHKRDTVQALGGASYFPFLGAARHIGREQERSIPISQDEVEKKLDYILGASMLVRRGLIEKIGNMNEEYFLYYEEIDWALRAKKEYSLAYAKDSIVYHKAGGSIGSSNKSNQRSDMSDFYLTRNRLILTRKYYPFLLPTVYLVLLAELLIRIKGLQWKKARQIAALIFKYPTP